MLGSIGVVYGDIGTSPVYALREATRWPPAATHANATPQAELLGVLSLILWALIVDGELLECTLILLLPGDGGEGGALGADGRWRSAP